MKEGTISEIHDGKIAENIVDGITAVRSFLVHEGDESRLETAPDYDARHRFLRTGAELLDAFPSKKIDATVTNLVGCDELDNDAPKALRRRKREKWRRLLNECIS